nr:antifreeze protein [Hemitripterus americanus]
MLTVSLLVCAMMALTQANDDKILKGTATEAGPVSQRAGPNCPAGWQPLGDRCIYYETTAMTWALAETNCMKLGGHLASIHSQEEHSFIQTLNAGVVWIGGSACLQAGAWTWSDGTPMNFRSWCSTKPDDVLAACCMQMTAAADQCWDDLPCPASHKSVCAMTF